MNYKSTILPLKPFNHISLSLSKSQISLSLSLPPPSDLSFSLLNLAVVVR
ncbi:hypothetical protein RchiOBHm_Chr2g0111511 [Rosa chinensis]|uniref:Uncharacterized protein n=1 Tax=Rosa chinensis TaxID=74649 RepID=A0A2P6RQ26_ROSCH|nr:hypothetical protein RchiOBHm_Chr2g0111511 [Rosa chinensis]